MCRARGEGCVGRLQVAREASRRVLGLRPFDVQLIGAMILHNGEIAEMRTGEGKTLVAVLPAYLNALSGKGVQVHFWPSSFTHACFACLLCWSRAHILWCGLDSRQLNVLGSLGWLWQGVLHAV